MTDADFIEISSHVSSSGDAPASSSSSSSSSAASTPSFSGIVARIRRRGATLSHLVVFSSALHTALDVVQGFDTTAEQVAAESAQNPYYSTIGRVANRTGDGKFSLTSPSGNVSKTYTLPINNGPNSLHGGISGFDKKDWTVVSSSPTSITLTLHSPDGDEGFPRPVDATVTYTVSDGRRLHISYKVSTPSLPTDSESPDAINATVANLTSHTYFNLSGFKSADASPAGTTNATVLSHIVEMNAETVLGYLEMNDAQLPTGTIVPTTSAGPASLMNFVAPSKLSLGERLNPTSPANFTDASEVSRFRGFDHFYMIKDGLDRSKKALRHSCTVSCPESKLAMDLYTDAPGFQLYTANWLNGTIPAKASTQGKGVFYGGNSGVCLETSAPPNAINSAHQEWRDAVIVRPGSDGEWRQETAFEFRAI